MKIKIKYIFILLLLICPFFVLSEEIDDNFYELTIKELENFQTAYGDDCEFIITNWDITVDNEFIDSSFDVNQKHFRIMSGNNEEKYIKELRKTFSVELASLVNESDIFLFNIYKNAVTIQGNARIGDILFVNSINGDKGTYIVSQKQKFLKQVGEEKKESTLYLIKPIRPTHLFNNARFTKKSKNLFFENSIFSTGFENFKGSLISKLKTSIVYPFYLNASILYSYDTGGYNTFGFQTGFEVMNHASSISKIASGLNWYVSFDFGVLYDTNRQRLSYSPNIELGGRWFFRFDQALSLGIRFSKEYYKEKDLNSGDNKVFKRNYSGIIIGFSMII